MFMTKRKNLVFAILIISIVCVAIGLLSGKMIFSKSVDNSTIVYTNSNTKNAVDYSDENAESDYPFSFYNSFLVNSSGRIIDEINNNPIDKMYYEKYINCRTPDEEQNVLSNWNKAYENELNNAKTVLEISINEKAKDNNISPENILSIINDYVNSCSIYADATSQLAYSFEEFNLGHGTSHTYDLLLNSLEINRANTLRLIECIYMLDESYIWLG